MEYGDNYCRAQSTVHNLLVVMDVKLEGGPWWWKEPLGLGLGLGNQPRRGFERVGAGQAGPGARPSPYLFWAMSPLLRSGLVRAHPCPLLGLLAPLLCGHAWTWCKVLRDWEGKGVKGNLVILG